MNPQDIEGWMLPDELDWLYDNGYTEQLLLEVGIWKGRSTSAICSGILERVNFSGRQGLLIAIDHFQGSSIDSEQQTEVRQHSIEKIARDNLREYTQAGVLFILPLNSNLACELLEQPVDFLFIDGCHSYWQVSLDIKNYSKLVKPGGIISGHDREFPGVNQALKELIPDYQNGPGSIWFKVKD